MDKVRLGRVLGVGARQAARTLAQAIDAAAAPDPSPRPVAPAQTRNPAPTPQRVSAGVAEGGRRFTESFGGRFKRLGGALWLEFTGVFFGIFALFAVQGVWKMRAAWHAGASLHDRQRLVLTVIVAVAFTYFCISNFVRAGRHNRGSASRRR